MARQKKLKPLGDYLKDLRPKPPGRRFDDDEAVIAYMKALAKRRAE